MTMLQASRHLRQLKEAHRDAPQARQRLRVMVQGGCPSAHRPGARIAFGTDMGVGPHGQNAREFGYMVEAGMPSREAIKAATVNAAKLLDLSDEVGTIASGKSADVIAVDSSPLDDVSVLERVAFVMARGDVYRA
jgi:imidazolonepropionase-like amidohydrolase